VYASSTTESTWTSIAHVKLRRRFARSASDPEIPIVLFVGRITRQKGILHLVRAIRHLQPGVQVVLCAGATDTDAIAQEMTTLVDEAKREAAVKVIWIPEMLPKEVVIALYSHAAVFVCPSVYEPFGIINLEAMACETPVIAAEVGGIPEIVVPGETGILVPFEAEGGGSAEPRDPERYLARPGVRNQRVDGRTRTADGNGESVPSARSRQLQLEVQSPG